MQWRLLKALAETRGHIYSIDHGIKVIFLHNMVGHSLGLREMGAAGGFTADVRRDAVCFCKRQHHSTKCLHFYCSLQHHLVQFSQKKGSLMSTSPWWSWLSSVAVLLLLYGATCTVHSGDHCRSPLHLLGSCPHQPKVNKRRKTRSSCHSSGSGVF